MPVSESDITQILKEKLQADPVIVEDQSGGCGAKFSVIVVSTVFQGKTPLDRHRLVNDALKEQMKEIHALTLKTWTPEQYEKQKQTVQIEN